LSKIEKRLDELHERRTGLVADRRSHLVVGILEDDPDAKKKLTAAERDLADVDRDISRAQDAKALAEEMAAVEREAEAAAAYKRDVAAWEAANAEMLELAAKADERAREDTEMFVRLANMAESQARSCPVPLGGHADVRPLGLGRTMTAIQIAFAKNGLPWARYNIVVPWQPVPGAAETITTGIAWARGEMRRKSKFPDAPRSEVQE